MAVLKMSDSLPQFTRTSRHISDKIIFISCEGCVTEESYFELICTLFSDIKSKIQVISVREDLLGISKENRTQEQIDEMNLSSPMQLVNKIKEFKKNPEKIKKYQFDLNHDDEFWVVADVDNHTESGNKLIWDNMIKECKVNNYSYAISNPFFELWLLLHHSDVDSSDYQYEVTPSKPYEKTDHFKNRLKNVGAALKDKKKIVNDHYDIEKVCNAITRAKKLDTKQCDWPNGLGTTVYRLVEKIVRINNDFNKNDTEIGDKEFS